MKLHFFQFGRGNQRDEGSGKERIFFDKTKFNFFQFCIKVLRPLFVTHNQYPFKSPTEILRAPFIKRETFHLIYTQVTR